MDPMSTGLFLPSGISVTLRRALESDAEAISAVFRKRTGGEPDTPQPSIDCVVAEVGNTVVAYGSHDGNRIKYLCRLKGEHLSGIADLILETLEKSVRDAGFHDIVLYAQPAEKDYPVDKLVRFYRRHGYELILYRQGLSIDGKPFNLGAEMMKRF
jgi:hypothetical protein